MHVHIQYYSMTASFIFLRGCRNTIILWYTPPIYYTSDDVKVQLVDPAIGLVRGVSTRCCSSQEYSYHFWLEAPIASILNETNTHLPIITRMFSVPFSSCLMPWHRKSSPCPFSWVRNATPNTRFQLALSKSKFEWIGPIIRVRWPSTSWSRSINMIWTWEKDVELFHVTHCWQFWASSQIHVTDGKMKNRVTEILGRSSWTASNGQNAIPVHLNPKSEKFQIGKETCNKPTCIHIESWLELAKC